MKFLGFLLLPALMLTVSNAAEGSTVLDRIAYVAKDGSVARKVDELVASSKAKGHTLALIGVVKSEIQAACGRGKTDFELLFKEIDPSGNSRDCRLQVVYGSCGPESTPSVSEISKQLACESVN